VRGERAQQDLHQEQGQITTQKYLAVARIEASAPGRATDRAPAASPASSLPCHAA
jgi:hypothetical protein